MFGALNAAGILRVTAEGELEGLDIDQHGISAYPDEQITAWAPAQGRAIG